MNSVINPHSTTDPKLLHTSITLSSARAPKVVVELQDDEHAMEQLKDLFQKLGFARVTITGMEFIGGPHTKKPAYVFTKNLRPCCGVDRYRAFIWEVHDWNGTRLTAHEIQSAYDRVCAQPAAESKSDATPRWAAGEWSPTYRAELLNKIAETYPGGITRDGFYRLLSGRELSTLDTNMRRSLGHALRFLLETSGLVAVENGRFRAVSQASSSVQMPVAPALKAQPPVSSDPFQAPLTAAVTEIVKSAPAAMPGLAEVLQNRDTLWQEYESVDGLIEDANKRMLEISAEIEKFGARKLEIETKIAALDKLSSAWRDLQVAYENVMVPQEKS